MNRIKRMIPWLALAAAYVFSVAWWGMYGQHNLISDDCAEMILAVQLNEEGKIITDNWFYSNELRLFSPVQFYQLALKVFPYSWHAARTLAMAMILAGVLAAFLYAAYGLGLRKSAPWIGTIFALPFSGVYSWLVINQGHYCVHVIFSLLMLGMIARCAYAPKVRGLCVGLAALGLLSALNGVRIMMMFVVPVFASVVLMAAYACKAYGTFREAAREPEMRMLGPTLLMTVCAGIGYVLNMTVLSERYTYYNYGLENLKAFSLADFLHQVDGLVDMFGYQANVSFFSVQGLSGFVALGFVVLLFLALFRMFARWQALDGRLRLLVMTAATSVALGMTLNVLLGQILARYFLVGILLLMLVLAAAIETEPCKNAALRGMVGCAVMGCLLFQTGCNLLYGYTQGTVNYEMTADWLLEHGYTQGYATYWNALPLTEASDGQITMWSLKVGGVDQLELFAMNQTKEHVESDPEGKVFLLVDELERESDSPLFDEAHLVDFVAWSYYVYEYDSVDEMRALIAQQ